MQNPLIEKFGEQKRWVNWRKELRDGKPTKVLYTTKTKRAESDNPDTWITLEDAEMESANALNNFNGIGIIFDLRDKKLIGIDIDKCYIDKKINHEKKKEIEQFIKEANTYTEISPSGTGFHVFLEVTEPMTIGNRHNPFEIYTHSRFFTVTFQSYGKVKPIRTITPEEALKLLSIIGYPWNAPINNNLIPISIKENLSDDEVLERMFSSKIGAKIKTLYDGDTTDNKGDDSAADYSLLKALAFWTAKNPSQMERIWLASPLGQRQKTKSRKDYRDRSIAQAVAKTTKIFEKISQKIERENPTLDLLFTYTKDGEKIFIQNTENVYRILKQHKDFQGKFRLDIFKNKEEIFDAEWREMRDSDCILVQTHLSILFPFLSKVSKEMVRDAISKISEKNSVHPPRNYITSLVWDKTYRLDTWLCQAYGVPDTIYHKSVGSNWLKGLVKRLIEPGCKFDYVLVLHGEQGIKKSTSFAKLIGEKWHLEMTDTPDHKDFFEKMRGKIIIEFSEGETLTKADVKKMKAVITMQSDTYRPSYGHYSIDFPRQCVFAMTTNEDEFLKDDTGNRRWLPVACESQVNIEWIEANRDQLFAEAYHRVIILKETTWEFPEAETKQAQEDRRIKDPNTDIIAEWYHNLSEFDQKQGITVNRIYKEVLNNNMPSYKPMSSWDQRQIAVVLKMALKLEKRQITAKGVRQVRWFNSKDETPLFIASTEIDTEEVFKNY